MSRTNFTMTVDPDLKKKLVNYSEKTGVPQGVVFQRLADEFFAGRIKTNALPALPPAKP